MRFIMKRNNEVKVCVTEWQLMGMGENRATDSYLKNKCDSQAAIMKGAISMGVRTVN